MMKKISSLLKNNRKAQLFFILLVVFIVSLCFYLFNFRGFRYSFRYNIAGSQKLVYENRNVPDVEGSSKLTLYVEELLSGPVSQRAQPFFPLGTRVIFCFLREGTMFLNLSEQAIMNFSPDVNLQNSYELLQMNVKANFPSVKKIELFIDGKSVFLDDKIQTKNN